MQVYLLFLFSFWPKNEANVGIKRLMMSHVFLTTTLDRYYWNHNMLVIECFELEICVLWSWPDGFIDERWAFHLILNQAVLLKGLQKIHKFLFLEIVLDFNYYTTNWYLNFLPVGVQVLFWIPEMVLATQFLSMKAMLSHMPFCVLTWQGVILQML